MFVSDIESVVCWGVFLSLFPLPPPASPRQLNNPRNPPPTTFVISLIEVYRRWNWNIFDVHNNLEIGRIWIEEWGRPENAWLSKRRWGRCTRRIYRRVKVCSRNYAFWADDMNCEVPITNSLDIPTQKCSLRPQMCSCLLFKAQGIASRSDNEFSCFPFLKRDIHKRFLSMKSVMCIKRNVKRREKKSEKSLD